MYARLDIVWVIVMFDLPTDTAKAKRAYSDFRKMLLEDGFFMMQYSIYSRHAMSDENARVHINRVKQSLPDDGEVRIVKITDKQFGKIEVFYGQKTKKVEKAPEIFSLF